MSERISFAREQNEFQIFSNDLLTEMFEDLNFRDVTLASDDGKLIRAHKVVLSASSSILKLILSQQKETNNPVIFCRGVKHRELSSMLEFIYLGQTSFSKDEVQRFLTIAEDFGVKGLVKSCSSTQTIVGDSCEEKFLKAKTSPIKIHEELENTPKQEDLLSPVQTLDESAYKDQVRTQSPDLSPIKCPTPEPVVVEKKEDSADSVSNIDVSSMVTMKMEVIESFEMDVNNKLEQLLEISTAQENKIEIDDTKKSEIGESGLNEDDVQSQDANISRNVEDDAIKTSEKPEKKKKKFKTDGDSAKPEHVDSDSVPPTTPKSSDNVVNTKSSTPKETNEECAKPKEKEESSSQSPKSSNLKVKTEKKSPERNKKSKKTKEIKIEDNDSEVTIKEESFYSHMNETSVDPNLSKLGSFEKQENGKYKCDSCDYSAEQKKHVFVHKISKHIKLKFECDVCESTFTDPRSLKMHKTKAHGDVRYECDLCERTTSTAYHLASHKRRKHSA